MPEVQEKTEEEKLEKPQKKVRSFLNKVVIRKLPPNLTHDEFVEIISPLPEHIDLYFCRGDYTLGAEATSRAYIEFKNEEDIFIFRDKFDGYVFVDSVRGSEYPAIVEYAPFQCLPKSRARKRDKNVGTIETEQHFLNFLEMLKNEEAESTKNEPKLEYSYQIKDDKKITTTPLIEFLAAKNQEKRDAKKKKFDDKRKQRDEEKQKKKIQVAKNVPEPIKESKDEVFEDGIMVRTVPSRLGRNDRKKDSKSDVKTEKEPAEKDQERREKKDKEKSEKEIRRRKERDEKRKLEREQRDAQKAKDREQQKTAEVAKPAAVKEKETSKEAPTKSETKRYSALRKARQEKSDVKESSEAQDETKPQAEDTKPVEKPKPVEKIKTDEEIQRDIAKKEARMKKAEELREKRAREADERAQRHIKNKDRPTLQIYQPKRRQESDSKGDNLKSSDEHSENSRKRSDTDKRDRRGDKKPSRKNSRDETSRKKTSRKNSDEAGEKEVAEKLEQLTIETEKIPEVVKEISEIEAKEEK